MRIDAWAFSATSHGKGLVNVIGGRLKSVVWQEIRSRRAVVTTAEEFFNVGKSLLPCIDVLYVESNVLRNRAQIAVDRLTTTPPQTIVGTHKLHHFSVYVLVLQYRPRYCCVFSEYRVKKIKSVKDERQ